MQSLAFPLKLDIHKPSATNHLERLAPHRSNFQPIHLGGSFTEAPSKPHKRSLQSPRATVPTPLPAFKSGPLAPLSQDSFTPPFCCFRFCERASLLLHHDHISVS
ncbi:hypothetical protein AVEN_35201-1 [Araneus ventricosus]|uniref:Uncharacterized protein n=1 Tax=Araneus ventricosus TaxID=182803 RepID=A0A4Y2GM39_ARAVE|nr:hypothetical protein AVEN_102505-1 [Araneus ventricosus]GBM53775.1 hypothetical protein AVEN_35201-1 [Araneus ventricosus]